MSIIMGSGFAGWLVIVDNPNIRCYVPVGGF